MRNTLNGDGIRKLLMVERTGNRGTGPMMLKKILRTICEPMKLHHTRPLILHAPGIKYLPGTEELKKEVFSVRQNREALIQQSRYLCLIPSNAILELY